MSQRFPISYIRTLPHEATSEQFTAQSFPDPELLELFNSAFFKNYQLFTEQIFAITNPLTATWRYISENMTGITGFKRDELYQQGMNYIAARIHPDDIMPVKTMSARISESIAALPLDKLMECRFSMDYRLRFADNSYHRILQHTIPLAVDSVSQITSMLLILADITPYKNGNYCSYQVTSYYNQKREVLLEGVEGIDQGGVVPTAREREMLELTAQGLTEKRIAEAMSIGIQTVKTYRKNLFRKTGCKNSVELVHYGVSHLWI